MDDNSNGGAISPIENINGVPAVQYLEQFASQNSFGMVEPNADWNQLMVSPAQLIIGSTNAFTGGAYFYPGDNLTIQYQNGTNDVWHWLAVYNSPGFTGPLTTGGDFYNFFVLGLAPANFDVTYAQYCADYPEGCPSTNATSLNSTTNDTSSAALTSWFSVSSAYPNTTMNYQENLGIDDSGYITGYFLDDISTAVLSIPSFMEWGDGIGSFSQAVVDFINNATQQNASKVIIDLQQNSGGQESLAFEVFRQFFPSLAPFAGSRMRSHYLADVLGTTMTPYFDSLNTSSPDYDIYVAEEWVVTDRVNVLTGQNFTSWRQFSGAGNYDGDALSLVEQYNLSSPIFDSDALGIVFPDCYFNNTCSPQTQWSSRDIILLTDGLCTSACTLFVEMMTQDANVSTVVVGGRPEAGPMQSASGSRGAVEYSSDDLAYDFELASGINDTTNATLSRVLLADTGMQVSYMGLTLRDQIRPNGTTPTQFLYLPADCRIYWTMLNWNNYTRLWSDAYNAIYGDSSVCITGSVKATAPNLGSTSSVNDSSIVQRRSEEIAESTVSEYISEGLISNESNTVDSSLVGMLDTTTAAPSLLAFCDGPGSTCGFGSVCTPIQFPCTSCNNRGGCSIGATPRKICVSSCSSVDTGGCPAHSNCKYTGTVDSKKNSYVTVRGIQVPVPATTLHVGFCSPGVGNGQAQCSSFQNNKFVQNLAFQGQ